MSLTILHNCHMADNRQGLRKLNPAYGGCRLCNTLCLLDNIIGIKDKGQICFPGMFKSHAALAVTFTWVGSACIKTFCKSAIVSLDIFIQKLLLPYVM